MTIVNLTPHSITLLREEEGGSVTGSVGFGRAARQVQFRPLTHMMSVGVARAATRKEAAGSVSIGWEEIPVAKTVYGQVEDLPEPDNDTTYVVSLITAQAAQAGGRTTDDLLVVGETVRDADGQIIGCTSFGRL